MDHLQDNIQIDFQLDEFGRIIIFNQELLSNIVGATNFPIFNSNQTNSACGDGACNNDAACAN